MSKRKALQAERGHKRSSFFVDKLAENRMDYIKKAYEIAFDSPNPSNTTIIRRAIGLLANFLSYQATEGNVANEKGHIRKAAERRYSPFGDKVPEEMRGANGKLLSFNDLANAEIKRRRQILKELKSKDSIPPALDIRSKNSTVH